jgi:hypothetical protein
MRLREAPSAPAADAGVFAALSAREEILAPELRLRPLTTTLEIAQIEPLRRQIPLPAEVLGDPRFAALEKKGTRWGSSPRSTGGNTRSAH